MKHNFKEIKYPLAHLSKNDQGGDVLWWEENGAINGFDDIPNNYPRWVSYSFDTMQEALQRFLEMTENEGWECIEHCLRLPSCKECPIKKTCDKKFEDCQFNEKNGGI